MSPDSESCSTRAGSGECGGGSSASFSALVSSTGPVGSSTSFLRERRFISRPSRTGESYAGSPISGSISVVDATLPRRRLTAVVASSGSSSAGTCRPMIRSPSSRSRAGTW